MNIGSVSNPVIFNDNFAKFIFSLPLPVFIWISENYKRDYPRARSEAVSHLSAVNPSIFSSKGK